MKIGLTTLLYLWKWRLILIIVVSVWTCSRTPATSRVTKQSTTTIGTEPHACIEIENHATLFRWSTWLAVASVSTPQWKAMLHNMTKILQLMGRPRHAAMVYSIRIWYGTSMLQLIGTCQIKVSAEQYHMTILQAPVKSSSRTYVFWSWLLTRNWFSVDHRQAKLIYCNKSSTFKLG